MGQDMVTPGHWGDSSAVTPATVTTTGAAVTLGPTPCQVITLGGNPAITPPPVTAGKVIRLQLVQDGTGTRVPTWVGVKWAAGTAPTLSTPAGSIDVVRLESVDGVNWVGYVIGKAFA